jgi:hypothetical protein
MDDMKHVGALKTRIDSFDRATLPVCCEGFRCQVTKKCEQHGWNCPDYFIKIGVTGNICSPRPFWMIHAENATYEISYCPFCGKQLPSLEIIP